MKLKKMLSVLLVLAVLVSMTACGGETESSSDGGEKASTGGSDTITIGASLPMTGSVALNGEMILEGIQIAVDECNEAGGIDGKEVVIDAQDDQAEPNQAASVANMMSADEKIVAIIGSLKSSCTLAAAPIYEEAGVVALSPDSSSPEVTNAGEYIFRIKNSDVVLAQTMAKGAISDGHTKFAILYENNDYGAGVLEQSQIAIEEAGCEIVCTESILTGEQTDFSSIISKIRESGADAILMGVDYNESGLVMKQMKDAGLDLPRYATDGLFTDAFIEVGGEAADGTTVLTSFITSDQSENVQNFIKKYQEKYDGEMPSIFQAEGYDCGKIVIEAIENAGTDRKAIRDYMATMSYQGVTGDCTFDENGDVNIPLKRCIVEEGEFVLLEE
ncbi:Leucine-%2C isoleucine-%2C valine-%2C threonine-%2C and alanine-binding protein precursor [Blautia hydrogenotrophica]|uniref:ABC transporter substrate-binding protein n=1 Tax=Blautia hydrogenotrophica TaxID=53443 RepID=UPI0006C6CD45|nr:ABC transporter substrate-binding protein [Blautia hydrogenotrophica]CUN07506.1 Leucine-%2C isoleucine-%2C valine-%2C threonine-%2C and alanine-binding protein precursor [Blautia hydrogenotrophica]SCI05256.1 Leucine-%2C isoleucine-%2C valine-%2C threonine-%2C and alanine-binding protein precursor [uncultured Blautia sp.]